MAYTEKSSNSAPRQKEFMAQELSNTQILPPKRLLCFSIFRLVKYCWLCNKWLWSCDFWHKCSPSLCGECTIHVQSKWALWASKNTYMFWSGITQTCNHGNRQYSQSLDNYCVTQLHSQYPLATLTIHPCMVQDCINLFWSVYLVHFDGQCPALETQEAHKPLM